MLPPWAPDLLAFFGHAPLALLALGVAIDLASLLRPAWDPESSGAISAYVGAAVTGLVLYVAGPDTLASVFQTEASTPVFDAFLQYQWYVLLFAVLYAALRVGIAFVPALNEQTALRTVFVLIAAAGVYLAWESTTLRAELVYRHGVGVQPVAEMRSARAPSSESGPEGLQVREDAWSWTPASPGAWKDQVEWVDGSPTDVQSFLFEPEGDGPKGLAMQIRDETVLLAVPVEMGASEITATLNLDGFDGTVDLVHHVRGAAYYDYLQLDANRIRLARREGSAVRIQDAADYALQGWRTYRLLAGRTQSRAFVGDQMVVSGTDTPASPGTTGLRISGSGLIRLRSMSASPYNPATNGNGPASAADGAPEARGEN